MAVCIVPTLLSVVSCGQQAADRDIAVADSLSEAAPQRAMTLIDSLEGESTKLSKLGRLQSQRAKHEP